MFNTRTLLMQRARSQLWIRVIAALIIAGFALLFVPFVHGSKLLWFVGLASLAYVLVSYTMGIRSWVTVDKIGNYVLCIRDNHSGSNAYVPFEFITLSEACEYSVFKNSAPQAYRNQEYHRVFKHFGYQGAGVIVCYQLPKHLCGDDQKRSWQFPAPKAEQLLNLLKNNASIK